MRSTFALLLSFLVLSGCDAQDRTDEYFRIDLNGKPYSLSEFTIDIVRNPSGIAGSVAYYTPGRFPRNLNLSLSLPALRIGTFPIMESSVPLKPNAANMLMADLDGDAVVALYLPIDSSRSAFVIESLDTLQRRVQGRMHGTFVVDPLFRGNPRRLYPDTLRIENGRFNFRLAPRMGGGG